MSSHETASSQFCFSQDYFFFSSQQIELFKIPAFRKTLESQTLNEVAPMKSFTVKTQYKFGLSDKTKSLIQARDKTRQSIGIACAKSKPTPMKKYKILRNKVTSSRTFP